MCKQALNGILKKKSRETKNKKKQKRENATLADSATLTHKHHRYHFAIVRAAISNPALSPALKVVPFCLNTSR